MAQRPMPQQPSVGLQIVHDLRIRFEHMQTGKFPHCFREAPAVVDRRENFQLFAWRSFRIVVQDQNVVLHAVARRNVHATGTLIERHKIAEENRRQSGGQGPLRFQSFEPVSTLLHTDDTIVFEPTGLGDTLQQLLRDDQQFIPDVNERVVDIAMQADRLIGRKRPRGGRPNDNSDRCDVSWKRNTGKAAAQHRG